MRNYTRCLLITALMLFSVGIPTTQAAGVTTPVPSPAPSAHTVTPISGVVHQAPLPGQTDTYVLSGVGLNTKVTKVSSVSSSSVVASAVPKEISNNTSWTPTEVITVTAGLPGQLPSTPASGLKSSSSSSLRATQSCNTANMYSGTSMLWAKAQQVWCYNGATVTYWPAASCWGYSAWYMPSYAYLGCSNFQQYGAGWNVGRMQWNADLCPGWLPGVGACGSHSYVHHSYEMRWNGGWISY